MSLFINAFEDDTLQRINIDDLYDNQKKRDQKQISIFNKILNRVLNRIKITGRTKQKDKHIWFNIPEYIFGEPIYDNAECIAYIIHKLEEDGFFIKYVHPNTLFISWENWVPAYVRNEIKKRRGIILDEKGNIIKETEEEPKLIQPEKKEQKQYTPIQNYKPSGNLIYNPEIIEKLEKRVVFS